MSYNNRRPVNVSQYLRDLNVQEPVEDTPITDDDLAEDLALFTNTQFFDFETGQNTDYQAPPVKPSTNTANQSTPAQDVTPTGPLLDDFSSNLDFMSSESWISSSIFIFSFTPLSSLCMLRIGVFSSQQHMDHMSELSRSCHY